MIDKISDMLLYKRIVELGSLTAAAEEMGVSPATVSIRLAALENSLGTTLLQRTTRQINITDAGERFLDTARRVLTDLSDFEETVSLDQHEVSGEVRVTAPVDLARNYVAPAIDRLLEAHDKLQVDLIATDAVLDLTGSRVDIAIRYGTLADSSLRLRRISANRRIPVASRDYLERAGTPRHPKDLKGHNCLSLSTGAGYGDNWVFVIDNKAATIRVNGNRRTSDGEVLRRWAIAGHGIALKSAWDVAEDIEAGRLKPLLVSFCPPKIDLQMLLSPASHKTRRVQALSKHIYETLRHLDSCLEQIELTPHFLSESEIL